MSKYNISIDYPNSGVAIPDADIDYLMDKMLMVRSNIPVDMLTSQNGKGFEAAKAMIIILRMSLNASLFKPTHVNLDVFVDNCPKAVMVINAILPTTWYAKTLTRVTITAKYIDHADDDIPGGHYELTASYGDTKVYIGDLPQYVVRGSVQYVNAFPAPSVMVANIRSAIKQLDDKLLDEELSGK